jgi:hypothetical protein
MTEGKQLQAFIDNQKKSKTQIANDLGMHRTNLYAFFESKTLEAETKKKFEEYFGKEIFTKTSANQLREDPAPAYTQQISKPLTEAEGIEFLKQHIQTLKENDAWLKKMFETNLASADSDRLAIMAQLKNLNVLAAEIFAGGDKKKYELKMKEYRKALGADGATKL